MKSVLISIQPKWCELIANGKKTIEVRKTKPKLETPFKVYIYETQGKLRWCNKCNDDNCCLPYPGAACFEGKGKVIGEFVCDEIETLCEKKKDGRFVHKIIDRIAVEKYAAMTIDEFWDYVGLKQCYAWHISDLVIYDKPKELSEFRHECKNAYDFSSRHCEGCGYYYTESNESIGFYDECACDCLPPITRPPQSWCYVEGHGDNYVP